MGMDMDLVQAIMDKTNRLFPNYIYLNGKKISIPLKELENVEIDKITLSLIRKKLGDEIPEDSRFISERDNLLEIEEEDKNNMENCTISFLGFNLFSESLVNSNNLSSLNKNPFEHLKLLEKKKFFDIYEYPQKKEGNDFLNIILFNEINIINGFLNYLFDIKYDDPIRLKLEENGEKNQIISKKYIQCPKGNFKFILINLKENESKEEQVDKIIELLTEEKTVNLFVINILGDPKEIVSQIINIKYIKDQIKDELFFIEPNGMYLYIKLSYYAQKLNINPNDKVNIINSEIMEETEKLFPSNHIYCEYIYDNERNKMMFCCYNKMMEGFSNFFNILIQRKNNPIDFSNIIHYLNFIKEKMNILKLKENEMDERIIDLKKVKDVSDELLQKNKRIVFNRKIEEYNQSLNINKYKSNLKIDNLKYYEEMLICLFQAFTLKEIFKEKVKYNYEDDSDDEGCSIF